MPQPATGAAALWGWRRERAYNVPGTDAYTFLRPVPPLNAMFLRPEGPSTEINASGFRLAGLPGPISAPLDIGMALTAANCLEPFENIYGDCAKSTLETNVFQYVFTPDQTPSTEPSLDAILCLPPVARWLLYGIKLSQISEAIANNQMIAARMTGFASHGTDLSEPDADGGNTGTYTYGPKLRGLLRNPREGEKVAVNITTAVSGGSPPQFKAERYPDGATPTFPGAAIVATYDSDGEGKWQNLPVAYQLTGTMSVTAGQTAVTGVGTLFLSEIEAGDYLTTAGETNRVASVASDTSLTLAETHAAGASGAVGHVLERDGGYHDENRDPLEIVWPGTVSDGQDDLDSGDMFVSDVDWSDPTPSYLSGQRYTSAHLKVEYRALGASTWIETNVTNAGINTVWAVTPDIGNGSRYPFALDRDTVFSPAITLARKYRDRDFENFSKGHKRFELKLSYLGQLLGNNAYRESIVREYPSVSIASRTQPVANAQGIIETLNLVAEADQLGSDPPCTATVITDRDWTPLA